MSRKPLYIFLHLPKTAGSTFVYHLKKNFGEDELLEISHKTLSLPLDYKNYRDIYKKAKKYIKVISRSKLSRIKVVYGHLVPYGVEKLFNRKGRYITFFRDPIERATSSYNYLLTLYNNESHLGKKKEAYVRGLLVKESVPDFYTWFEKKWDKENYGFGSTSDYKILQYLNYLDKGDVTKKSVSKMLDKFYFVGLTKTFSEGSLFVYKKLKIKRFFVNKNVSKKYFQPKNTNKIRQLFEKIAPVNYVIYDMARKKYFKLSSKSEFKEAFVVMKTRKLKSFWWNQIIFDFRYNMGEISSAFRKMIPLYGYLFDKIKGK